METPTTTDQTSQRDTRRFQANPKEVQAIVEQVWNEYFSDMDAGQMSNKPGRSRYECAFYKAGILERGNDAQWRDWFFNHCGNTQSPIRKAIGRAERKAKKLRLSRSEASNTVKTST